MNTVFINCSPKKKLSVSGFIGKCAGFPVRGKKEYLQPRTPADRAAVLEALKDADTVVFVTPLYVDGLPSHILPLLKEMEASCRENMLHPKVYAIANNGFIEGRQNEPLMRVLENFCTRAGLEWRGGIGIGGGVMLNAERLVMTVMFFIMLLNIVLQAVRGGNLLEPVRSFGTSLLQLLVLCCGILTYTVRLAVHINRGTDAGKRYTRIMLPSFVFILFADLFFIILSVFQGGIFRGWFSRFKPDAGCSIITEKGD